MVHADNKVARGSRWIGLQAVDFKKFENDEGYKKRMQDCLWDGSKNLMEKAYKLLATADIDVITSLVGISDAPHTE